MKNEVFAKAIIKLPAPFSLFGLDLTNKSYASKEAVYLDGLKLALELWLFYLILYLHSFG